MTTGYPGTAFKTFTGRFLDSQYTQDYQGYFRTGRAFRSFYAPSLNRIYMIIGSAIFAYDADRFFTRLEANETLIPSTVVPVQRGATDRPYGPEYFLKYDAWFYAENYPSGWQTPGTDGQQRMFYLDYDDQGYLYLATIFFGWGIIKDPGTNKGDFMASQFQTLGGTGDQVVPSVVAVVKGSGGKYYAIVSDAGSSYVNIWDVTDRTNPRRLPSVQHSMVRFAKNSAMTRIAVTTINGTFEIYNVDDFIAGRGPITSYSANGASYRAAASDGTNFFSTTRGSNGAQVVAFAAVGDTFTKLAPVQMSTSIDSADLRYSDGYLVVGGTGDGASTARVFKIDNLVADEIDMTTTSSPKINYLTKYYTVGGGVYVKPAQYMNIRDSMVIRKAGKVYLIVDAFGLGDVYELRAGDSVAVQSLGSSGTHNPKTPNTTTVYGDPLYFQAHPSGQTPLSINWNFGNNEAAAGADPNATTTMTDITVKHQYSGISTVSGLGTRTIIAANAGTADRSGDGELGVVLTAPTARFGVTNYKYLFTQPDASSSAPIVDGDRFFDASDGLLEGHWGTFTIQTPASGAGVPTNTVPNATVNPSAYTDVPVGQCGDHAVTFLAHYGPYVVGASGPVTFGNALNIPDSSKPALRVAYTVRPFAAGIDVTADPNSSTVNFSSISKVSSSAMNGTQAAGIRYTWSAVDAGGSPVTLTPAPPGPSMGSIAAWNVNKSSITRGTKVRLTLEATAGAGTSGDACSTMTTSTVDSAPLNSPAPVISGDCTAGGPPCVFTAASQTPNLDQVADGWIYSWSVSPSTGVVASAGTTSATYKPTFTVKGTYTITLTVKNNIGQAQAQKSVIVNTVGSLCPTMVENTNIFISYAGTSSGCNQATSQNCTTADTINFNVSTFNYNMGCSAHTFQWNFADSSAGATTQSAPHKYTSNGTYAVTVVVDNGSQQITLHKTVVVGSVVQPPPPPPPPPTPSGCALMTASNVFIGMTGTQSGCTAINPTCKTGEQINFTMSVFNYNSGCANHTVSWSFGDGNGNGASTSHTYQTDGTRTVTMTVYNGSQTFTATQPVTTNGGGTNPPPNPPPSGGCAQMKPGTNIFIAYTGPTTSCSQNPGSPACGVNEPVAFHIGTFGYNTQCANHTYAWTFGDNATANSAAPTHPYATDSIYHVKVTVNNGTQSVDLLQDVNVSGTGVTPTVTFDFTIAPWPGVPNGYIFTPKSNPANAVTTWTWDFGDGEMAPNVTSATRQHAFPDNKKYTVKLTSSQFPNNPAVTHQVPPEAPHRRAASH